jgi:aerobic carbon-monoxide dehydrogenase small subunit
MVKNWGLGRTMNRRITLVVNGQRHELEIEPRRTLVDVLRTDLGLTGTKKVCELGDCGACTVIMDGRAVNSCLVLGVEADGKEVLTVEGLATGAGLDPLQQSFVEHGAVQCGFCTPGMLLSAKALLDENPKPSELEVRTALAGNLCRCTGYAKIVEAVMAMRPD